MMKKRMKLSLLLVSLLVLFALLCTACGTAGCDAEMPNDAGGSVDKGEYGDGGMASTQDVLSADRKIIKTVYETVETKEYDDFIVRLKAAVSDAKGYFASSRYTGDGYEARGNRNAYFEIRIPADGLSDFTAAVGDMGSVSYYTESENDITAAYVDVESRIGVLAAEETALREMLAKSETVSDMLEIEARLSAVMADLASLKAQKNTYDSLVAYSTVNLTLKEVDRVVAPMDDTFFGEVKERFSDNLYGIGSFFRSVGVFFLGNSPVLLVLVAVGVGVFFLVRHFVLRSKRQAAEWEEAHKEMDKEQK